MRSLMTLLIVSACVAPTAPAELDHVLAEAVSGDVVLLDAVTPHLFDAALTEGIALAELPDDALQRAGLDVRASPGLIGSAGLVVHEADFDQVVAALLDPEQDELSNGVDDFVVVAERGDPRRFAHGLGSYAVEAIRVTNLGPLGSAEQEVTRALSWHALADGTPVVMMRQLAPDPATTEHPAVRIEQQFEVSLVVDTDPVRRIDAMWVDASVSGVSANRSEAARGAAELFRAAAAEIDAWAAR